VRFSLRRLDLSAVAARRFNRIFVAAIVVDFVVVVVVGKADLIFLGSYLMPLFLSSPSHFVFLFPAAGGGCCTDCCCSILFC
jgi:hypothetical protein